MRSLDTIFKHIGPNLYRTILFEDGKWCLYKRKDDPSPMIVHRCSKAKYALANAGEDDLMWKCGSGQQAESGCGEEAPEKLKGLWRLYTWER